MLNKKMERDNHTHFNPDLVESWLNARLVRNKRTGEKHTILDYLTKRDSRLALEWQTWRKMADSVDKISKTPVLAICGGKNAGKSTMTGHMIGEDAQKYVLRGEGFESGTQRFVLWCPLSWKTDHELSTALSELLKLTFAGDEFEELSGDVEKAHQQYAGAGESLLKRHVPLLAYSGTLDRHGYAVMDCPDIDSSHDPHSKDKTAQVRRDLIKKAVAICSGFMMISEYFAWQNAEFLHLVKYITEITDESANRFICLTKTSQEWNNFDDIWNKLNSLGLPSSKYDFLHSPYSEDEVRYFGTDGLEWVAKPDFFRPPQTTMRDILKNTVSLRAFDLFKTTCEMMHRELAIDVERSKLRTDGIRSYLTSHFLGPEGELGYIPALAGFKDFLEALKKRKKVRLMQDFPKLMEDPSSVKTSLGQKVKNPKKRAQGHFCKIRQKDFESWARETAKEEGHDIQNSKIPQRCWARMAQQIHERTELNGSTSEISNCILWWIYQGGIRNRLLRKDVSKMRTASDFLAKTLLNPTKCEDICMVARSEITRVLGLKEDNISKDTLLGMEIDNIAVTQATAIQNWLHDLMGLPRRNLTISINGEKLYTLKALTIRKLTPLFEQNGSLLPDLFEADMAEVESIFI